MNSQYFVFDTEYGASSGADGCIGVFEDWNTAFDVAKRNTPRSSEICIVANKKLKKIASVYDDKWYFDKECPFYPFAFDKGSAVTWKDGTITKIGNVGYGVWQENGEIFYVVNNAIVDESNLRSASLEIESA